MRLADRPPQEDGGEGEGGGEEPEGNVGGGPADPTITAWPPGHWRRVPAGVELERSRWSRSSGNTADAESSGSAGDLDAPHAGIADGDVVAKAGDEGGDEKDGGEGGKPFGGAMESHEDSEMVS